MSLSFELLGADGAARRGRIGTAHGTVETPAFMPVGTAGTVKAMLPQSVAVPTPVGAARIDLERVNIQVPERGRVASVD